MEEGLNRACWERLPSPSTSFLSPSPSLFARSSLPAPLPLFRQLPNSCKFPAASSSWTGSSKLRLSPELLQDSPKLPARSSRRQEGHHGRLSPPSFRSSSPNQAITSSAQNAWREARPVREKPPVSSHLPRALFRSLSLSASRPGPRLWHQSMEPPPLPLPSYPSKPNSTSPVSAKIQSPRQLPQAHSKALLLPLFSLLLPPSLHSRCMEGGSSHAWEAPSELPPISLTSSVPLLPLSQTELSSLILWPERGQWVVRMVGSSLDLVDLVALWMNG